MSNVSSTSISDVAGVQSCKIRGGDAKHWVKGQPVQLESQPTSAYARHATMNGVCWSWKLPAAVSCVNASVGRPVSAAMRE